MKMQLQYSMQAVAADLSPGRMHQMRARGVLQGV